LRAREVDWIADPEKWTLVKTPVSGKEYICNAPPVIEKVVGVISKGMEDLKANPENFIGLFFQSEMLEWPEDEQEYKIVKRGAGFHMKEKPDGKFTWVRAIYQALPADVSVEPDAYTDEKLMSFQGNALPATRMPGRGQGCADVPSLDLIEHPHPMDVAQGAVGDCWLLSAISAAAEFKGVIEKLFEKTPDLHKRPLETFNKYTITLYDLSGPDWKPVDVIIDERLCSRKNGSGLLGADPTDEGELWACYLEKAMAAHCGGWDEIDGGNCIHAWRMMFGSKYVYTFNRTKDTLGFTCRGTFNPNDNVWEQLDNSPNKGFRGLWPMVWPEVGGGGDIDFVANWDEFFTRLEAWDKANFIMACGSEGDDDDKMVEGIVQGHCYTLISACKKPAGVNVDLVKVRNPWGKGEFKTGKWDDDGPGWKDHPEVKDFLKPDLGKDDGIFWMDKEELFDHFQTFYLCAVDMATMQSDVEI